MLIDVLREESDEETLDSFKDDDAILSSKNLYPYDCSMEEYNNIIREIKLYMMKMVPYVPEASNHINFNFYFI